MPTGSQPPRHPHTEIDARRVLQAGRRRSAPLPSRSPRQLGTPPVAHREEQCQKATMLPRRQVFRVFRVRELAGRSGDQDHHLHHGSPRRSRARQQTR